MVHWKVKEVLNDPDTPEAELDMAYHDAMVWWRGESPEEAKRWEEIGWLDYVAFNARLERFLWGWHMSYPVENIRNAILFRRAVIHSLEGVENYQGEITFTMQEAGTFLLDIGFTDSSDVPEDLAGRVAEQLTRLEEMDDEDLARLYRAGAHWLIGTFRTPEEMVDPLRAIGTELRLVPVMWPIEHSYVNGK
jgi:hypothetical protein